MFLSGGICDLMVSAIEMKKSLKEFATIKGFDEIELSIEIETGFFLSWLISN